jgi:hypothetical protein
VQQEVMRGDRELLNSGKVSHGEDGTEGESRAREQIQSTIQAKAL